MQADELIIPVFKQSEYCFLFKPSDIPKDSILASILSGRFPAKTEVANGNKVYILESGFDFKILYEFLDTGKYKKENLEILLFSARYYSPTTWFRRVLKALDQESIDYLLENEATTKQLAISSKRIKRWRDKKKLVEKKTLPYHCSGFLIPVAITDEMATFIGLESGVKISRVDCTKGLQKYILEKNLPNPENRREIIPDQALASLLKYDSTVDGPLYYYTLQKLIQKHFVKPL